MLQRNSSRLFTYRVPGVEVWCREGIFVYRRGHFCGRGREMLPPVHVQGAQRGSPVPGGVFCPRRRCPAWKFGARRWLLSTDRGIFVDAEGRRCRLSTYRVPSVEVRCRELAFVHRRGHFCGCGGEMLPPVHVQGAFCGSSVPGGGFCPQAGAFLWMRRGNVAACPRTGCPAWMQGAQGVTFWCRRALRFRLFSVFKISNSKKRKMWGCREENFTQNVVREGVCC